MIFSWKLQLERYLKRFNDTINLTLNAYIIHLLNSDSWLTYTTISWSIPTTYTSNFTLNQHKKICKLYYFNRKEILRGLKSNKWKSCVKFLRIIKNINWLCNIQQCNSIDTTQLLMQMLKIFYCSTLFQKCYVDISINLFFFVKMDLFSNKFIIN